MTSAPYPKSCAYFYFYVQLLSDGTILALSQRWGKVMTWKPQGRPIPNNFALVTKCKKSRALLIIHLGVAISLNRLRAFNLPDIGPSPSAIDRRRFFYHYQPPGARYEPYTHSAKIAEWT